MRFYMDIMGEAVPQGRPRFTSAPFPRAYDPKKSADFKTLVAYTARQTLSEAKGTPLMGAVAMEISVNVAIPTSWSNKKKEQAINGYIRPTKKPDLDNVAKSIQDALTGVWYVDDKQIVELRVEKSYSEFAHFSVEVVEV